MKQGLAEVRRRGPRLFGHPVHPMVAGFPVAFWIGGFAWDIVALLRPDPLWPQLALWTLALGLIAALPTAVSGLWEFVALPAEHPGELVVWWHMGIMSTAFCCVLASVVVRHGSPDPSTSPWLAVTLAGGGAGLTVVGGWLGGELVFRHGLGVEKQGDG